MTLGDSLPWAQPVACGGALAFFLRDFSVISAELSIRVGPVIVRHFATRSLRRSVACTSVFHTGGICVCQTRHSTGVRARGGCAQESSGHGQFVKSSQEGNSNTIFNTFEWHDLCRMWVWWQKKQANWSLSFCSLRYFPCEVWMWQGFTSENVPHVGRAAIISG